jgi:glycosyltransferase involved in cell wall biosynthesis
LNPSPNSKPSICLLPKLEGFGGPASFQARLTHGLTQHGIQVHHDPTRKDYEALLIVGGSHQILDIFKAKQRGVRIVQRLDGMNWMHRVRKTGTRHFLRAEYYNRMLAFTRHHLADHIVYQSEFSRDWWNSTGDTPRATSQVTYNGVDLDIFTPLGKEIPPNDKIRVLVIEALFGGGYESGLENAIDFAVALRGKIKQPLELFVIGETNQKLKEIAREKAGDMLRWGGRVAREEIPAICRSAQLLFSADINPACPNSVIEALACGLPVVGYATGSLAELVGEDGGKTAAYGSNFWKLEAANPVELVDAALVILKKQSIFRLEARKRAEQWFGLERMTKQYLQAFSL